jgi:hypothetical protein
MSHHSNSHYTPEYYLARDISKEMRKEDSKEYKRKVHQSSQQQNPFKLKPHVSFGNSETIPGVKFAEPAMIMSGSGTIRPGFVITTSSASSVYIPVDVERPSPRPTHSSQSTRYKYPTSEDFPPVPPELKARGIRSALESQRWKESHGMGTSDTLRKKCRISECRINHSAHFCNVCEKWDVSHLEKDCFGYK